uniref:CBM21 domain-containing protein n=1 Tax=Macrostomum lignano TaxID=282301 RepID=A0A1I8JR13_9PLAT
MGLDLTQVRLMREPSWVPPVLPREILANLPLPKNGSRINIRERIGATAGEHLSVQTAVLSSQSHARGIVNVKNVCFDKRVFVRVSFDSWRSYKDFDAKYLSLCDGGLTTVLALHSSVPLRLLTFEFCVCFEALSLGQSFWDNAVGQNYQVSACGAEQHFDLHNLVSHRTVAAAASASKESRSSCPDVSKPIHRQRAIRGRHEVFKGFVVLESRLLNTAAAAASAASSGSQPSSACCWAKLPDADIADFVDTDQKKFRGRRLPPRSR